MAVKLTNFLQVQISYLFSQVSMVTSVNIIFFTTFHFKEQKFIIPFVSQFYIFYFIYLFILYTQFFTELPQYKLICEKLNIEKKKNPAPISYNENS